MEDHHVAAGLGYTRVARTGQTPAALVLHHVDAAHLVTDASGQARVVVDDHDDLEGGVVSAVSHDAHRLHEVVPPALGVGADDDAGRRACRRVASFAGS